MVEVFVVGWWFVEFWGWYFMDVVLMVVGFCVYGEGIFGSMKVKVNEEMKEWIGVMVICGDLLI